jgi:hypothetical protein
MGKGPGCFVQHGAVAMLEELGHQVELRWVRRPHRPADGSAFGRSGGLAEGSSSRHSHRYPVRV